MGTRGFPGDPVVKNLPANAGDEGSIPVVRRREVWLFSFLSPTCSWPGPLCSLCIQTPPRGEERQARTQPKTPQSSGLTVRATPNLETGPASCPCMTQTFSLSFKSWVPSSSLSFIKMLFSSFHLLPVGACFYLDFLT